MTATRRIIAATAVAAAALTLAQPIATADAMQTSTHRHVRICPIPLPAPGHPKQRPARVCLTIMRIPMGTPHAPTSRGAGA